MKSKTFTIRLGLLLLMLIPVYLFGQARLQVIHNSADAAASQVDVWLNDQLLIDNFAFRTASPFIDAPAGVDFDVVIQPSNSTDTTNALARFTYNLSGGSTYVLVANGIVVPAGYNPATPFDIYVYDMGREAASNPSNTDLLVFHGSTDAPTVDVVEVGAGAGTIINDLEYAEYAGYLELPTSDYSLQIRDESGTVTVAQYDAPLATLGLNGAAAVVVASGFLDPAMNNNGPAFGLYVALPSGGELIELGVTTDIAENQSALSELTVYPNPVSDKLYFNSPMMSADPITYAIYSSVGKVIMKGQFNPGAGMIGNYSLDVTGLPAGQYILAVEAEGRRYTSKLLVVH